MITPLLITLLTARPTRSPQQDFFTGVTVPAHRLARARTRGWTLS
jgi:hypothetical protein